MSARANLIATSVVRTVYGLVSLFAPRILFGGSDAETAADTRYFNGLFGGRDLTVAGMTVAALAAGREREALLINASCEATDLLAAVQEIRERGGVDRTVGVGLAFNLAGWAGVLATARALRR